MIKRALLWIFIFLFSFLSVTGVLRIFLSFVSQLPASWTELPTYHIEGWTMAALRNIEAHRPIYSAVDLYQSPIYQPIPYYVLSWLSRVLSPVTGFSEIGSVRLLSFVFPFLTILIFATVSFLAGTTRSRLVRISLSIAGAFTVAPAVFFANHVGLAFPHELTKFYLALLCVALILSLKDESTDFKKVMIASLLAAAPWFRQTYFLITLPMFLIFLYRFWRTSGLHVGAALVLYFLTHFTMALFVLTQNPFTDFLDWTIHIPGHHDKGLIWMPDHMVRICITSFSVYFIALWIIRRHFPKRSFAPLVALGVLGCLTSLFHSMKQGSGTHMADTIIYPMAIMIVLSYAKLDPRKTSSLVSTTGITLALFAWIFINQRPALAILHAPPKFIQLTDGIMAIQKERKDIWTFIGQNHYLSLTGPIEKTDSPMTLPLQTSMLETSYTYPSLDGTARQRMSLTLRQSQILVSNLEDKNLLYLPDNCTVTETKLFPRHQIFAYNVSCLEAR